MRAAVQRGGQGEGEPSRGAKTIAPTSTMLTPHKIFKLTAGTRAVRQLEEAVCAREPGGGIRQGAGRQGELALKGVHGARTLPGTEQGRSKGRGTLKRLDVLPFAARPFWLASYLSTLVKPAWHLPVRVYGCVCVSAFLCMCVCLPSGFVLVLFFFCTRSTFFLAVAPDKVLPLYPPAFSCSLLQRCQTVHCARSVSGSWPHSAASLTYFFLVSLKHLKIVPLRHRVLSRLCCFLLWLLLWLLL